MIAPHHMLLKYSVSALILSIKTQHFRCVLQSHNLRWATTLAKRVITFSLRQTLHDTIDPLSISAPPSPSPRVGKFGANVKHRFALMAAPFAKGISTATKRARSQDSLRRSETPPASKASRPEEPIETVETSDDLGVPAFLRQSKYGKHSRLIGSFGDTTAHDLHMHGSQTKFFLSRQKSTSSSMS